MYPCTLAITQPQMFNKNNKICYNKTIRNSLPITRYFLSVEETFITEKIGSEQTTQHLTSNRIKTL